MRYSKNIIKFAAAIILLIIIPLVPLTVSKIQDDKLIEHLQVEKIKSDNNEIQTSKLTVAEKLELICDYENKEKNIITTTQVQDMSDENITIIRTIINEQLVILKNLGILTDFNFDGNYVCYNYTLRRYSNVIDSSKSVSVYQVNFTNEEGIFNATIDVDTHLIYQYNYYNKKYIARNYEVIYTFGTAYLGLTEQETYKYLFGIIDNRTDSVSVSSYNDIY